MNNAKILALVDNARTAFAADPASLLDVAKEIEAELPYRHEAKALWAAAMTLRYGPTGLHPSRADANGRPLPETLRIPAMSEAMRRAGELVPNLLWRIERDACASE